MKYRYSLSYREIKEIGALRFLNIDNITLQRQGVKFTPPLGQRFRKHKKPAQRKWMMDETYIKVKGRWVYLYRAVDKCGNTIDFLLRVKRDEQPTKDFFEESDKIKLLSYWNQYR